MISLARKILPFAFMLPVLAHADAIERLNSFFQNTASMRAQFHQTVLDAQGRKLQDVTGTMQLMRPGKFRWDYHQPYVQLIVGDGKKVWLFDPELEQVTVRSMDKALGSTPAALLAGSRGIDKLFTLKEDVRQDDVVWLEAVPKEKDGGFEKVLLGFRSDVLAEMQVHDNFGQITVVEFTKLERNPKLAPQSFRFSPPAGVDVLEE